MTSKSTTTGQDQLNCAHCHTGTVPCPLDDGCPGTRNTGTPAPCTRCHNGRLCPLHGRLWTGAL